MPAWFNSSIATGVPKFFRAALCQCKQPVKGVLLLLRNKEQRRNYRNIGDYFYTTTEISVMRLQKSPDSLLLLNCQSGSLKNEPITGRNSLKLVYPANKFVF